MTTRPLKTRLFIVTAMLLLLSLGAAWFLARHSLQEQVVAEAEQRLSLQIETLESMLQYEGLSPIEQRITELSQRFDSRISLVDLRGKVILDSMEQDLDNHAGRPEIREAREKGQATSLRYSRSTKSSFLYSAKRVETPSFSGVIRVACAVTSLDQGLAHVSTRFLLLLGLVALLALALLRWILKAYFAPLTQLAEAANQVTQNQPPQFPLMKDPHLSRLSLAMASLTRRLTEAGADIDSRRKELEILLQALPVGVVALSGSRLKHVNPCAKRLLGLGDFADRSALEILPPEVLELLDRLKEGENHPSVELALPERNLWLYAEVRHTDRGPLVVLVDRTEAHHLEAARRTFVADVGHEFQTPLTAIGMTAEFMMADVKAADKVHLERLLAQQKRLTALVDTLLYLSRLESHPDTIPLNPVDLVPLVNEAANRVAEHPLARFITFTTDLPDSAPCLGDSHEISTALNNLLDNAVKFTAQRYGQAQGGTVAVTLIAQDNGWAITVSDNGPGLDVQQGSWLFDRFTRGDSSRNRKNSDAGGYGLGLAIVKRIMERHRGTINIVASPEGATLRIWFPLHNQNQ